MLWLQLRKESRYGRTGCVPIWIPTCSLQPATTALEAHGVDAEEALEQLEKLLAELHKIEEV